MKIEQELIQNIVDSMYVRAGKINHLENEIKKEFKVMVNLLSARKGIVDQLEKDGLDYTYCRSLL